MAAMNVDRMQGEPMDNLLNGDVGRIFMAAVQIGRTLGFAFYDTATAEVSSKNLEIVHITIH